MREKHHVVVILFVVNMQSHTLQASVKIHLTPRGGMQDTLLLKHTPFFFFFELKGRSLIATLTAFLFIIFSSKRTKKKKA